MAFADTSRPVHVTQQRQALRKARQTPEDTEAVPAATPADEPTKLRWEDSPEKLARTIFVGNVPVSVVSSKRLQRELHALFEPFGTIESLRFRSLVGGVGIVSKRLAFMSKQLSDKRHTCNCYLVFATPEAAQAAVSACNGRVFEEHHLRVDLASNADGKPETKKSIFVGNLPLEVRDESLWRIFGECGRVTNVRVIRDKSTGAGKGIAYVTFGERATVELALKLAGSECEGRPMRISKCAKAGYQEAKKAHQQRRSQALERRKEISKDRRANQTPTTGRVNRQDRPLLRKTREDRVSPRNDRAPPRKRPQSSAPTVGGGTPVASAGGPAATPSGRHPAEIRKERKLLQGTNGANPPRAPPATAATKTDHRKRAAPPAIGHPVKTARPEPARAKASRTPPSRVDSAKSTLPEVKARAKSGSSVGRTKRSSSQQSLTAAAAKKKSKQ